MMSFHSENSSILTTRREKETKKQCMEDIEQEYSIKRCNFNPISPSPNKFIKNLRLRMRMYYRESYKSYK